ncbi:MAG: S8 family serine peptidase [Thermodesulfobacteriota bacterium]
MKHIFLFFRLLLVAGLIITQSCGSGSSDRDYDEEKEELKSSGIVRISGNAFADFDLKGSDQNSNNSPDTPQYITTNSKTCGYVDFESDPYDWYAFYSENDFKISFESENNILIFAGPAESPVESFEDGYKFEVEEGSVYYIKIDADQERSKGNYFFEISEVSKLTASYSDSFVPGEIIVKYKENSRTVQSLSTNAGLELELKKKYSGFNLYKINTRQALSVFSKQDLKQETLDTIEELNRSSDVEYAEPNFIRKPSYNPDDYYYTDDYLLWNLDMINTPGAWNIARGDNIIAAVLDTGIITHEDLPEERIVQGYDFIDMDDDPNDPGTDDLVPEYHGTHVAGVLAAEMDNAKGIAGVAPGALIMPLRIGDDSFTSANISQGIYYAAGIKNSSEKLPAKPADIINMSFGAPGFSDAEQEAVQKAAEKGLILTAAAGNNGVDEAFYPAAYSEVINVSAVDSSGDVPEYSNYGSSITLAAPGGGDEKSDMIAGPSGPDKDSYYLMSGTSVSAPHVAGVIALMKSIRPELNSIDIFNLISAGEMTYDYGDSGFDNYYGYGLIDAEKSVYNLGDFTSYTGVKILIKNLQGDLLETVYPLKKVGVGKFEYRLPGVSSGDYIIEAGFDLNNDNDFDDHGELSTSGSLTVSDEQTFAADTLVISF